MEKYKKPMGVNDRGEVENPCSRPCLVYELHGRGCQSVGCK